MSKKWPLIFGLLLLVIDLRGASMTQDQALTAAQAIWSNAAFAKRAGRNYQVGCKVGTVTVTYQSKSSFDDALSRVNMAINGPHVISATATDDSGQTADAPPVTVFLCN